jgi:hypothetical protein
MNVKEFTVISKTSLPISLGLAAYFIAVGPKGYVPGVHRVRSSQWFRNFPEKYYLYVGTSYISFILYINLPIISHIAQEIKPKPKPKLKN